MLTVTQKLNLGVKGIGIKTALMGDVGAIGRFMPLLR